MIKKISVFFLVLLLLSVFHCQVLSAENDLKPVRLIEVVHSIFYAPQYIAMEKGFFQDEGLDIELFTAWGGDKAAASLMAGSGDIALIGPEPSIYVFEQGAKDFIVNFAQLTSTAGSFLVAREPMPDFKWEDVINKKIIGNRPGGAPQMVLEYSLKERGIIPGEDVEIITNLDFTANAGAFLSGRGDFVQLFEPAASTLEAAGQGYAVASFGKAGGNVPYTVYMAKVSFLKDNPEIIQRFTNAIYRAQLWVLKHNPEEIAELIGSYFEETSLDILIRVIQRYQEQGSWSNNPLIEKEIFEHYEEIIIMAGELAEKVDYKMVVNTEFARKAIEIIK
ncbi:ABC transporter substrate-binding protein [Iocasia frigidifontis]|uniref:ABC transporter substrate-binding protein n=1 Tax=Iocasia fonsfrigidae TaxID=2682810 RepID=UPI001E2E2547|nr:ABC transporter substrate-binding protein [Iocasia fonsfrigidae]